MVEPDAKRLRINSRSFLDDFVRGVSEEEILSKYSLTTAQYRQAIGVLKHRGTLTPDHMAEREENLKLRYGNAKAVPPASQQAGKVAVDLDSGLVLHCPSCGASVERDAQRCGYCNSALDFSLKGKTRNCPHCFERIPAESRFCFRCARPVKAEVAQGHVLPDRLCPRCNAGLMGRKVSDFAVMECDACTGIFIPHETFEMMQDSSQRVILPTGRSEAGGLELEKAVTYVRCPVCRTLMNRKNFAGISGVIVDVCGYHGVWFDSGELGKVMDFVAHGGLLKAREKEQQERLREYEQQMRLRREEARMSGSELPSGMMDPVPQLAAPGLLEILADVIHVLRK